MGISRSGESMGTGKGMSVSHRNEVQGQGLFVEDRHQDQEQDRACTDQDVLCDRVVIFLMIDEWRSLR